MKKENLKNIQIVCRNKKDVKKCIKILKQIGLKELNHIRIDDKNLIIVIGINNNMDTTSFLLKDFTIYFFNKTLIKMLNNIPKKEEKKLEDFEVAEDGRITKVNNYYSDKKIFIPCYLTDNSVNLHSQDFIKNVVNCGLIFATEEARDKAHFKMEIETKLKNIAERLNNGKKMDWKNHDQKKYYIYYFFEDNMLDLDYNYCQKQQGCIYCLSDKFLDETKKEIGEDNLIKYFKGE